MLSACWPWALVGSVAGSALRAQTSVEHDRSRRRRPCRLQAQAPHRHDGLPVRRRALHRGTERERTGRLHLPIGGQACMSHAAMRPLSAIAPAAPPPCPTHQPSLARRTASTTAASASKCRKSKARPPSRPTPWPQTSTATAASRVSCAPPTPAPTQVPPPPPPSQPASLPAGALHGDSAAPRASRALSALGVCNACRPLLLPLRTLPRCGAVQVSRYPAAAWQARPPSAPHRPGQAVDQ